MAEQTSNLAIDYPSESENPFHDTFQLGIDKIDVFMTEARELASLIVIYDPGFITFDAITGYVTWATPMAILSGRTNGGLVLLPATVTLAEEDMMWAQNVAFPIQTGLSVHADIASGATPPAITTPGVIPIFKRLMGRLYVYHAQLGLSAVVAE